MADAFRGGFKQIDTLLKKADLDSVPDAVSKPLKELQGKIDEFFEVANSKAATKSDIVPGRGDAGGGRAASNATDPVDDLPTVIYTKTETPEISANIENALNSGAPDQLNRATSKSVIRRNRREELADTPKAKQGKSLDEYPFASTQQGGKGATVAEVPKREQDIQGGKMSSFYQKNGIGDGDPFRVKVED